MSETCRCGHPLAGDNVYVIPKTGKRRCKACRLLADQRRRITKGLSGSPYLGRYAVARPGRSMEQK